MFSAVRNIVIIWIFYWIFWQLIFKNVFPHANLFTSVFLYTVVLSAFFFYLDIREKNKRCKHNFKGGIDKGCPECINEQLIERARLQKEQEARDRKQQIEEYARQIYNEEIQKVYQHNFQSIDYLQNKISPRDFEMIVAKLFAAQGYEVEQTPYVNDGGKDLIVRKDAKTYYVECKQHNNSIGRPLIQKLVGAMHGSADAGFFVITSKFTDNAIEYARQTNVELIDQNQLIALYKKYFPSKEILTNRVVCKECGAIVVFNFPSFNTIRKCPNGHDVNNNIPEYVNMYPRKPGDKSNIKMCRSCGSPMRIIKGKRGKFWGCSQYPGCRYTENYK